MNTIEALKLYEQIIIFGEKNQARREGIVLRAVAISSISSGGIIKLAFDTRRINQETDYNPRRGLQNYHRSEQFISEAYQQKIANFSKLKVILDQLKEKYGREPEWQDSYCRVLLNTLDNSLRINQKDGDFGESQPSIGSFDYVEELLFARYRLEMNSIAKYGEEKLKEILLSKDEPLIRKTNLSQFEITKRDVSEKPYDALIDKLFNGVRASKENPNVKRSVTITIHDTFLDDKETVE